MIDGQAPELTKLVEELSKELHGMTQAEALAKGICLECKEPALPKCYSDAGRKEYRISGFCEKCFDGMFADEG